MTHNYRELPRWNGPRGSNGCSNPRCGASTKYLLVLSVDEVERVFPKKASLPWWPVPPQATHVCINCGYCYEGVAESYAQANQPEPPLANEVLIDEWEWEHEAQFEMTVREAVDAFIAGAPDDVDGDEIAVGVHRFVSGASAEFARERLSVSDDERTGVRVSDFM